MLWTVHETDLGRRAHFVLTGGSDDIQRIRKEFDKMGLGEMSPLARKECWDSGELLFGRE